MIHTPGPQVVVQIIGRPGTGKSTILNVIHQALMREGLGMLVAIDDNGDGGELEPMLDPDTLRKRVTGLQQHPGGRHIVLRTKSK